MGIYVTKNQQYDAETQRVFKRVLKEKSNCIDIGCHKGEVLDEILKNSPHGHHYAFEPIPSFFSELKKKYNGNCTFYNVALSDKAGETSFNYVTTNPAYSGILQRKYKGEEHIELITVKTDLLDQLIEENIKIDLIKIDVEGAEYQVLKGAKNIIIHSKPTIIFEHGLGASDIYKTTPKMLFEFLTQECGLKVSLMSIWLNNGPALSLEGFEAQYFQKKNHYFIAYS